MHHNDTGVPGAGPDVAANTHAYLQLPHGSADLHSERSSDGTTQPSSNLDSDGNTHPSPNLDSDGNTHPSPNLRPDTSADVRPDSPANDSSADQCGAHENGMQCPRQLHHHALLRHRAHLLSLS